MPLAPLGEGHGGEARLQGPEAAARPGDQPVPAGRWRLRQLDEGGTSHGVRRHVRHLGALWHAGVRRTRLATDYAEATKRRAKAAACDANNFDFMTWAPSTRGGIGREAAAWFTTNFAAKIA